MNPNILHQSFDDLTEDLSSLYQLATDAHERLLSFQTTLNKHPDFFETTSHQLAGEALDIPLKCYDVLQQQLQRAINERDTPKDEQRLTRLITLKTSVINDLRALQSITAGIVTSMDWQSPSYNHSIVSQAGRETGKITGTMNDYKRDHHRDAEEYEEAFGREYLQTGLHLPRRVYATSSGMSAFSTIMATLAPNIGGNGIILAGENSYFENKKVLRQLFESSSNKTSSSHIEWVDEMNSNAIIEAVRRTTPRVIVLDTLCNAESIAMPDLERLIPLLSQTITQPTYLVLDNSARALTFHPLRYLPLLSNLRVIVFESLNKYHQFGFDRVTGGIIWHAGLWKEPLFNVRMHFGLNIPDASVLALPKPNAKLLEQRLTRMGRNAMWLAERLETHIQSLKQTRDGETNIPFDRIVYPGLPSYPGHTWTRNVFFHGSYFVLKFKADHADVSLYEKFLALVMSEAKKAHVSLTAGTSFGFDTTRIYLTARHAEQDAKPFVRISLGTESIHEMEQLKKIFIRAMDQF